jgi:hypothetical protein
LVAIVRQKINIKYLLFSLNAIADQLVSAHAQSLISSSAIYNPAFLIAILSLRFLYLLEFNYSFLFPAKCRGLLRL